MGKSLKSLKKILICLTLCDLRVHKHAKECGNSHNLIIITHPNSIFINYGKIFRLAFTLQRNVIITFSE